MKKVMLGLLAVVLCFSSYAFSRVSIKENKISNFSTISIGNDEPVTDINEFLKNYYNKDYKFGKSADVSSDEVEYTVSEIILEGSEVVNGYTVVNKTSNALVYFMDIDRVKLSITAIDLVENETVTLINKEQVENVNLDFLSTLNNSNTSGGRFWGWSCGKTYSVEPGSCYRTCTYYILGQAWTPSTDSYDCDRLPGKHPKLA